ncbi:hypothetical protein KFE96_01070 [Kordiimonas sp. SCSIO 12603]|uniref:VOC family protein n=1 Tax=Kordiimonas sp. SCSIO 12603 TaxID=2829596 RepID=UPI00210591AD|nr:VOC family protein [Kordiimonas sp. SCSIO 12603]UTW58928.1 hypothetical protein KFE96_01070 [Kordiimonas sp. SCSIO 12603]
MLKALILGAQIMIQQLTPNLPVDSIEPSAEFFAKIGFEVTVRVPEEGAMGFAILMNGNQQVMYQTHDSLKEDDASLATAGSPVLLYVTVNDLDAVAEKLKGYDKVMEERTTFYGAREITYREPGGHLVTFAQFPEQ